MRCVMCLNHLEAVTSDNLAIYRCYQPDCPLFRLYQAGLPEPTEGENLDELAERIIKQHHDEPPVAPSMDSIEDEPLEPSKPKFNRRAA